jgi:hypothetical protein
MVEHIPQGDGIKMVIAKALVLKLSPFYMGQAKFLAGMPYTDPGQIRAMDLPAPCLHEMKKEAIAAPNVQNSPPSAITLYPFGICAKELVRSYLPQIADLGAQILLIEHQKLTVTGTGVHINKPAVLTSDDGQGVFFSKAHKMGAATEIAVAPDQIPA